MIKSIYFTIIILLISVNTVSAQNNCFMQLKYLLNQDTKNISNEENNTNTTKKNPIGDTQKQNYITAITANNKDKSITITGIPAVSIKIKQIDNTIIIELPNSTFSKQINNTNYNWTTKLHSQIIELSTVKIIENKKNNNIIAFLNFTKPQEVKITRVNTAQVSIYFISKQNNKLAPIVSQANKYKNNNTEDKKPYLVAIIPKMNNTTNLTKRSFVEDRALNDLSKTSNKINIPELPNNKIITTTYQSLDTVSSTKSSITEVNNIDKKTVVTDIPKIDLSLTSPNNSYSENNFTANQKQLSELYRLDSIKNPLMKSNDYDDLLKIAASLEFDGNLPGSLHQYSNAIIADPLRYEAYSGIADIYFELKDYNLAIENYEKSLNINKNQVKVLLNLANCYSKTSEDLKAIETYQKVCEIQPTDYESKYKIADLNFKLGNYNEAIKYYINCISLPNNNLTNIDKAKLHYNLANSYKAQHEPLKAIDEYKISIDLFKEFADSHYNLAATYIQTNKKDLAIEELNRFIIYSSSQDDISEAKKIINKLYNLK